MAAKKKKRYTDVKRRITRTPTGYVATLTDRRIPSERAYIPENTPENRARGRVEDGLQWTSSDAIGDTGQSRASYRRMQERSLNKIGRSEAALKNKTLSKAGKSRKNPAARAAQTPYKTALQQYQSMTAHDVSTNNPPDWQ